MQEFGSGLQPNLACQGKLGRLFALGRVCMTLRLSLYKSQLVSLGLQLKVVLSSEGQIDCGFIRGIALQGALLLSWVLCHCIQTGLLQGQAHVSHWYE